MLNFYATGAPFEFKSKTESLKKRHVPRLASPDQSGRMNERNYINQFNHEFKPTIKHNFSTETYIQNKKQINRNFKDSIFFDYSNQQNQNTNHKNIHFENFRIERSKKYAEGSKKYGGQEGELQHFNKSQRVLSRKEYNDFRKGNQKEEKNDENNNDNRSSSSLDGLQLRKRNFYMTRPNLRLNEQDKQKQISNVNQVSEDNQRWIANCNQKYEHLGNTAQEIRKQKQLVSNQDIIGNEKLSYPIQPNRFYLSHPGHSHRNELNRMHPVDNDSRNKQKSFTMQELKSGKVNVEWNEQKEKQSYDRQQVSGKVGGECRPFIKHLEVKRNKLDQVTQKISRNTTIYQPIKQDKYATLKIGHGKPEILTYKA